MLPLWLHDQLLDGSARSAPHRLRRYVVEDRPIRFAAQANDAADAVGAALDRADNGVELSERLAGGGSTVRIFSSSVHFANSRVPSALNDGYSTASPPPTTVEMSEPSDGSKTLSTPSSPATANIVPSAEYVDVVDVDVVPRHDRIDSPGGGTADVHHARLLPALR